MNDKPHDDFLKRCAGLIQTAVYIDYTIDLFISEYYVSHERELEFIDNVLRKLGTGYKIDILKKILLNEQIDGKEMKDILNALNFIVDIRNKVAHNMPVHNPTINKYTLQPRKSSFNKNDIIELDKTLMDRIDKAERVIYTKLQAISFNFPPVLLEHKNKK